MEKSQNTKSIDQQPSTDPGHTQGYEIIVNGRPSKWPTDHITFEEVVKVAFPNAVFDGKTIYTVTWKHGKEGGSLTKDSPPLTIKGGTIFNVTPTDKS